MARKITHIVVHCSAARPMQAATQTAKDIDAMHKQRGFRKIGYHYFHRFDGTLEKGRTEAETGAHVQNHNSRSIGICYAGGLDLVGAPRDTRSAAQRASLERNVRELLSRYPGAKVCGHRDLSPDTDRDGKVERHEWLKDCPCFDVAEWLRSIGLGAHCA